MKPLKERSARGTRGFIMSDPGSSAYFRVYNEDGSFTDYDLFHSDLEVMITDEDAMFKGEDIKEPYLDYSNQTLGETGDGTD